MEAKLVLLLPTELGNRRYLCGVYTVAINFNSTSSGQKLFANFLQKANNWSSPRREPQLREINLLVNRAFERSTSGMQFRNEGLALALPEQRSTGWENRLPTEIRSHSQHLRDIPALRLYCTTVFQHLVLFDGGIKQSQAVADQDSNIQHEFNQANRLCLVLKQLEKAGRLRNDRRSGLLDTDFLGAFTY